MKLLKPKAWCWYDIALLKWSCILFGMVAGSYFADIVSGNVVWFLLLAILFAIRPAITYFKG